MQRVDALTDLRLDDPKVGRDAQILENIKNSARRLIARPQLRTRGGKQPSLYRKYRGTGFPLKKGTTYRIPIWRDLTPWMKVQLATLVLAERGYMQFKLHIHDDLWAEIKADDRDPKVFLRNAISRHVKRGVGVEPWFFFVMEERSKDGRPTRPHAHGSIIIPRSPLPAKGPGSRMLRALAKQEGLEKAELAAGEIAIVKALKAAGGVSPRFAKTSGVDQCRNLWHRKPYHPLFNSQWVDYAFKHSKSVSRSIGENRLALPYGLLGEAQKLWRLLTIGEAAIDI